MDRKQHDKGLEFAKQLRIFARTKAPDDFCERAVHALVNRLEIKYGWSSRRKMVAIVEYLGSPDLVIPPSRLELAEHFRWRRDDVEKLIDEMVVLEMVVLRKDAPSGEGRGRPPVRVALPSGNSANGHNSAPPSNLIR
jgi:hypothetical protein